MRCRSASLGFTTSLAVPTTRVRKTPRCRSCRIIAAQQWQILARPCCRVSVAEGGQLRQGIAMIYRFYSFVPSKSMSTLVRLGWCFDLARIVALRPILAGDEVTVLPAQREREVCFRFALSLGIQSIIFSRIHAAISNQGPICLNWNFWRLDQSEGVVLEFQGCSESRFKCGWQKQATF